MSNKLTQKEVQKRLKKYNLKLISNYICSLEYIDVECFCGKKFTTVAYYIFKGARKSCGCLITKNCRKQTNYIDLSGRRFGKLTVISRNTTKKLKNKSALWDCVCECGNKTIVCTSNLNNKSIISCGCGRSTRLYKGYNDLSFSKFQSIRRNAESRNLKFSVTIEFLWKLFQKQKGKCALSGMDIKLYRKAKNYNNITASVDRIDPLRGYTEDNVQWVHKDINKLKWAWPENNFQMYVKLIYENLKLQNYIFEIEED